MLIGLQQSVYFLTPSTSTLYYQHFSQFEIIKNLYMKRKPIDKPNQMPAIKHGEMMEKKLHHVKTSLN